MTDKIDINLEASSVPLPTDFSAPVGETVAPKDPAAPSPKARSQKASADKPMGLDDFQDQFLGEDAPPKPVQKKEASDEPVPTESVEDVKPDDKKENFANIRKQLKSKEEEISNLKKQLEDSGELELTANEYKEKFEGLSSKLEDYEKQVEDLSKYRDVVDMTSNPKYQERITQARGTEEQNIINTASQYGVDKDAAVQALKVNNLAEMEKNLTDLGMTSTGIMTIMESVRKLGEISALENEYKADAGKFLKELQTEQQLDKSKVLDQIKETVSTGAPVVWDGALDSYREEAVRGQFPTMQKTGHDVWDNAVSEADNLGKKVFADALSDLESIVKHQTITPAFMNKQARLAAGYAHMLKDQKVFNAVSEENKRLKDRIAILEGDSPSMGDSSSVSRTAPSAQSKVPRSFEEIGADVMSK